MATSPVTAFFHLPLKPELTTGFGGPGNEASQALQNLVDSVLQQPGAQRIYWSFEIENQSNLRVFIDWDAKSNYLTFLGSSTFKNLAIHAQLAKPLKAYGVALSPHPPSVLGDGLTGAVEVLTNYFASDISESLKKDFDERITNLTDAIKHASTSGQFTGLSVGWSVEDDVTFPDGSAKGKAHVTLVGWTSVEAHLQVRASDHYQANRHYLVEAKETVTRDVIHVKCTVAPKQ